MKEKELVGLLKSRTDQFASFFEISQILRIDISKIRELVESLRFDGYNILFDQSHSSIKLISVADRLIPDEIKWQLANKIIGSSIYCYESAGSTMDIAKELSAAGAEEGTVVIAEEQYNGRGRYKRQWISPKKQGLYFSVILYPDRSIRILSWLTLIAAIAIVKVIRSYEVPNALIKWPNDILIDNKKTAGILTEKSDDASGAVILGIGININTPKNLLPAGSTSLKIEKNQHINRVDFLRLLLREIESNYCQFLSGNIEKLKNEWKLYSNIFGRRVTVSLPNRVIEAHAVDIDHDGALIVRLDHGFLERVVSGDVQLYV